MTKRDSARASPTSGPIERAIPVIWQCVLCALVEVVDNPLGIRWPMAMPDASGNLPAVGLDA